MSLLNVLILVIVVCGVIYVVQQVPGMPPFVVNIIWVLLAVVVAIFAVKFLYGLVMCINNPFLPLFS